MHYIPTSMPEKNHGKRNSILKTNKMIIEDIDGAEKEIERRYTITAKEIKVK